MGGPLSSEVLMITKQKYSWTGGMSTRAILDIVEVMTNFHYKFNSYPMTVYGSRMIAGDPSCLPRLTRANTWPVLL
jgi:hypothetical protein